jgi:TonB family protein
MRPAFFLVLFICGAASAQEDAGAPKGVLTKPPAILKQVEAIFPTEMLDAGAGGTVVMEVDLGADGKVMDARVIQSAGAAFDHSALEAVRQFEFTPAEVDGVPAPVRIQYDYEFFFRPEVVTTALDPDAGTPDNVVNFEGTLVERGTRTPLPGATIAIDDLNVVSDDLGRFFFTGVPAGPHKVVVVAPDYARYEVTEVIKPGEKTVATYFVRRKVYGAFETVVRAQRERKEVAQITLKQEEIRLIPGTNGDAFKVVQNLPGVARSPFGIGLVVIRGSKPYDTRTYVDSAQVPLLFHFGGLFSTFNSNLLQDINFQPGNFGVEYGRNIGGLIHATVRTPSQQGWHGYTDINVVDGSALLEGPVSENWSIAASFRRSWIDVLLPWGLKTFYPKSKDLLSFTVAPNYFDWQLRAEWKPKTGNKRFFVTLFGSSDSLKLVLPNPAIDPEGRGEFGTTIAYNRLLIGFDAALSKSVSFSSRTWAGLDSLTITGGSDLYAKGQQWPMASRNAFTIDFDSLGLSLATGIDLSLLPYRLHFQSPPPFKLNQIPDPFLSRQLRSEDNMYWTFQPAVFAELTWRPYDTLKLIGGVRADYETQMNKGWVDPRLVALWTPLDGVTIKAGAGQYHQPPDYRSGTLSKKFGNPDLLPEGATHYTLGVEGRFTDAISLDVQIYYKDLFHQARATLALESGVTNVDDIDLNYVSTGIGRGYGLELLLRHALTKNFFGWISYSLSRTERDYRQGQEYGAHAFDQPHNLVIVASYKLPFDFIAGAKLRYTTGPLNTPTIGSIYDANGNYYYPLFGKQWSRRLPDFFQLDLRLDRRFVFERWMLAFYVDIQNVTNRQNVEGVTSNYDYTKEQFIYGLPIVPVMGMRAEW